MIETLRSENVLSCTHLVRVLRSLVQTPSVNPGIYEDAMVQRISTWLGDTPAELHYVESLPSRYSIAAVLKGSGSGPTLVLNGHMDTVPVDDADLWHVDPFAGEVRGDYMLGRGACDMKAGLTIAIAVAQYLSRHRHRLRGTLVCHFAIGEEAAEPGTLSLCQAGFVGDVGIVLEPTELKVATAERGRVAFTIRVPGRSAHAGQPTEGLNPISRLPAVLAALDAYTTEITQQTHPLLGSPSCTPTIIRGGTTSNAVPDYCDITVDRRLLPGETISGARALLERCLQRASVGEPEWQCEVTTPVYAFAPAEIPDDSPFALQVCEAVRVVTGAPGEIYGTPFSSDVHSLVNDAGMEAVTFGPGKITECHCCNEQMSLGQLTTAALATAYVASELLL